MTDFVINHALTNLWFSAPYMDQQLITKPVKISPIQGALGYVKVLWRTIGLPSNDGSYYFVYQIGQVDPELFNLPYVAGSWMNAGDLMGSQSMVVKAYNDQGLMYPVGECWFYVGDDNNLLMAIRVIKNHPVDFTMQTLHLELYSNAYVNSTRWGTVKALAGMNSAPMITYVYQYITSSGNVTAFRNAVINGLNATVPSATVLYYKNGRYYSDLSGSNDILVGDYVEAVIDASVKTVKYAPLVGMLPFTSTLDTGLTKRIFPPTTDVDTIDYFDAVDFYLTSSASNSIYRQGIFFNQEGPSRVRMITHNCYSLLENSISALLGVDAIMHADADVNVVAVVRNSGLYRSLLQEGQRISELYRLPVSGILGAMVGTNATIPEWTASSLEASAYTAIMSDSDRQVIESQVETAYGYNLMSKTFAPIYPSIYTMSGGGSGTSLGYNSTPSNIAIDSWDSEHRSVVFHMTSNDGCDIKAKSVNSAYTTGKVMVSFHVNDLSHQTEQYIALFYCGLIDSAASLDKSTPYSLGIVLNNGDVGVSGASWHTPNSYTSVGSSPKPTSYTVSVFADLDTGRFDVIGPDGTLYANAQMSVGVQTFANAAVPWFGLSANFTILGASVTVSGVPTPTVPSYWTSATDIFAAESEQVFDTPIGADNFTITNYDIDGLMLSMTNCSGVSTEPVPSPVNTTVTCELTPGLITDGSWATRYLGVPIVTVTTPLPALGFRCYVCPQVGGIPNNRWIDATGTDYYAISPDGLTLTWNLTLLNTLQYYPAVFVGGESLSYQVPLNTVDPYVGFIAFSITENVWLSPAWPPTDPVNATIVNQLSTIQTGSLDIFMDGCSLVEGIDYTVIWPKVVIMKKPARTPADGLQVYVRAYGFCDTNMTREGPTEVGFVIGGVVSLDQTHQLRNDRNFRVSIGGALTLPSNVSWAEDNPSTDTGSPLNGFPYGLSDVVMPVDAFTNQETYAYREVSLSRDTRMGQYLTRYLPGTPMPSSNPINGYYELVSPFMAALIQQFVDGWDPADLTQPYNNLAIDSWVTPWKYLLVFDPCLMVGLNMNYLYIVPHQYSDAVTLTSAQYAFLNAVIGIYLSPPNVPLPRLDLSAYITISG